MNVKPSLNAAVLCITLALPFAGWAQTADEGSIEGTVNDASGAVIPTAQVTARNTETGARCETATNQVGYFRCLVVPVGTYEIEVEHAGFTRLIVQRVAVTVGAKINLQLGLSVAVRSDTVTVGGAPLVETARSEQSSTLDQKFVSSLPLNGRNLFGFVSLIPGAGGANSGINFAGQAGMHSFLVDGTDQTDTFFRTPIGGWAGSNQYEFSQEAVREFQVHINSYSAEAGRAGTGVVNVVLKSGTNNVHGSGFWYFRDRGLNATDAVNKLVGAGKDPLHAHQFGGALGGPLRKDRIFFYGNYDGQRRTESNLTFLSLPDAFRLSPDPTKAAFQQRALDYLTARAAPWLKNFDQNVYMAKLDWQITSGQLLTARWNEQRFFGKGQLGAGPQTSLENTGALGQNNDIVSVSLRSTLSPSISNIARFSYVRNDQPGTANSVNPAANVFESGQHVLNIGRNSTAPREIAIRRTQYADTLLLSRGRHQWKIGVDLLRDGVTFTTAISFSGVYRFNSLESFGRSLAGAPSPISGEKFTESFSGEGRPGNRATPNSTEFAGFVEDEWRLRNALTFTLGVRYDLQWMSRPPVRNSAAALAAAGIDTSFVPRDANNFAPRVGLAWNTFQQRLVLRAGYGIFYPRTNAGQAARAHYQNGVSIQTRVFNAGTPTAALIPSYPNTLCGPPNPAGTPPSCTSPIAGADTLMPFARSYRQPMVQQGSLGVEYQLKNDWAVSVSYLGLRGVHLERYRDINLATPSVATIGIANTNTVISYPRFPSSRPIAGYDRILALSSDANSTYHGMAAQLRKRFSRNYQLLAGYTFGKALDDNPDSSPLNPGTGDGKLLSDSFTPSVDRGASDSDQRHRFVMSGIWLLNHGGRLPNPLRGALQDWELSAIFVAESGQPYSGLVNFDLNNDGNAATDRASMRRNAFYTPGTITLDPRLTRNLQLSERMRMQFIWEAFNVLNRVNISDVHTTQYSRSLSASECGIAGTPCLVPQNTGTTAFGFPTGTTGPRVMQFAVKLLF